MRLTVACLLIACLHVSAAGYSQDNITLNLKSVELRKAIIAIEKKTDYRFLFNEDLIAHKPKVDINVVGAPVTQVLDQLLQNTGITYKVLDSKLVVLKGVADIASLTDLVDTRINGRVTGEAGEGLAGVSVSVKGSSVGTTTDLTGHFALTVPDNATLVFSSVGYESKEQSVAGQSTLNVSLALSTKVQEQVVVIGYGTASKRDLTGSIVKISGKEIQDKPNSNPVSSLQSKVAGLYVVNNGTPGSEPDIRIRGTVSIGAVHPLYVVDGLLEDNIDFLNPTDIESIEVLKDPSSLAIFGVRGATGVIAVTTKRARAGQTTINLNQSYGIKKLIDKIKLVDASGFNTLFAEENANNGVPTPDYSALNSNTDWIDAVTQTGHFNNTSLSVSSSSDKNRFNMSLGYIHDEGIILHEQLEKMLLSLNDEVKFNKFFKVGFDLNATRIHNPYTLFGPNTDRLNDARKAMPNVSSGTKQFKVKNPYGSDSLVENLYSGLDVALQNSGVVNPLLEIQNTYNREISYEYRALGTVYAEVNFLRDFTFRATWYADISNVNNRQYVPLYYAYNPLTNTPYLYSTRTSVSEDDQNFRKYQQDYVLNWKKQLGDHNITATGGFTTYYFGTQQVSGTSSQGTGPADAPIPDNPRLWYLNNGFGIVAQRGASSYQSENATVSYLGRVLYNYKNKYYINASYRSDGSSRIPLANRYQSFWSVGGAWELSRESFMDNVKPINFLKLKASYGVLGNQSTFNEGVDFNPDYPSYPGVSTSGGVPFNQVLAIPANTNYDPSPDLRWETVNAGEAGIELNAFDNRFHFEAVYYSKLTKDMMTLVDLTALGLKPKLENGGSIKNWGEEFSGSWDQKINKDFSVNIGGNITFMKNVVKSVAADLPGGLILRENANNNSAEARTQAGEPIGAYYGYVVEGLYQSNLDILTSPPASSIGTYRPGDFKFKDISGPNGKPDGIIDANDRTFIGDPSPKFIYGSSIALTYHRFNVSVDFGGVYGNDIFRVWGTLESPFQRVNYAALKLDRWHGPGTSNWEPIISQADRFNYNGSTYNIEDGSYFRIRNLQVGYDFNPGMLTKARIKNLRVYANAQNLKTWKNNNGYTPEFGGDATDFGFDQGGGAIPVIYTMGINVTF